MVRGVSFKSQWACSGRNLNEKNFKNKNTRPSIVSSSKKEHLRGRCRTSSWASCKWHHSPYASSQTDGARYNRNNIHGCNNTQSLEQIVATPSKLIVALLLLLRKPRETREHCGTVPRIMRGRWSVVSTSDRRRALLTNARTTVKGFRQRTSLEDSIPGLQKGPSKNPSPHSSCAHDHIVGFDKRLPGKFYGSVRLATWEILLQRKNSAAAAIELWAEAILHPMEHR